MHDKNTIHELINEFYSYAKENMGFNKPCKVFLRQNTKNASEPLGKSAYYDPDSMEVHLYITGRHPKDILRSFSHELMHHVQNCRGDFNNSGATTEGYAQKNEHLRKLEVEAYTAAIHLRDWTDTRNKQGIQQHRGDGAGTPGSIPLDETDNDANWTGPAGESGPDAVDFSKGNKSR